MRKGASPVIAALLLIGIAVAGSVITYTFVMSMVKSQGSMAQIQIRLDEVLFGYYDTEVCYALKVTVRNTGAYPRSSRASTSTRATPRSHRPPTSTTPSERRKQPR